MMSVRATSTPTIGKARAAEGPSARASDLRRLNLSWSHIDYRSAITNLPTSYSAEQVIDETYGRCDQENVIEQLQNGVAAMRMPTGSLLANAAYMICAPGLQPQELARTAERPS